MGSEPEESAEISVQEVPEETSVVPVFLGKRISIGQLPNDGMQQEELPERGVVSEQEWTSTDVFPVKESVVSEQEILTITDVFPVKDVVKQETNEKNVENKAEKRRRREEEMETERRWLKVHAENETIWKLEQRKNERKWRARLMRSEMLWQEQQARWEDERKEWQEAEQKWEAKLQKEMAKKEVTYSVCPGVTEVYSIILIPGEIGGPCLDLHALNFRRG